jgi:hypothetical protein
MTRVHITLSSAAVRESGEDQIVGKLRALGVSSIDARLLPRYGIVSGEVPARQLGTLQSLPMVEAVEEDAAVSVI